jgi:hypothetical protein
MPPFFITKVAVSRQNSFHLSGQTSPNMSAPTAKASKDRLVIAVDLGTTFSGVAYAFNVEGKKADVTPIQDWPGKLIYSFPLRPPLCYCPVTLPLVTSSLRLSPIQNFSKHGRCEASSSGRFFCAPLVEGLSLGENLAFAGCSMGRRPTERSSMGSFQWNKILDITLGHDCHEMLPCAFGKHAPIHH